MCETGSSRRDYCRKIVGYISIFIGVVFMIVCCWVFFSNNIPEFLRIYCEAERYVEMDTVDGEKVKIPKMTFADACNIDDSECIENVLVISGEINSATLLSYEELSKESLKIELHTVCLNSIGGSVEAAVMINEFINKHDLNTCLASRYKIKDLGKFHKKYDEIIVKHKSCYSACPLIIASSGNRTLLGDSFVFGVHSSGYSIMDEIHVDVDGEEYLKFLPQEMKPFFEFTQTIPSQRMYILSDYQIQNFRVFNDYRGGKKDKKLFKTQSDCKLDYFISSKCPLKKVIEPYPEILK